MYMYDGIDSSILSSLTSELTWVGVLSFIFTNFELLRLTNLDLIEVIEDEN